MRPNTSSALGYGHIPKRSKAAITTAVLGRDATMRARRGGLAVTRAATHPLFAGYRAAPATNAATMYVAWRSRETLARS